MGKNKNKNKAKSMTVTLETLEAYAKRNPKGKVSQSSICDVVITAQTDKNVYITVNREPKGSRLSIEEYWRPIWAYNHNRLYLMIGVIFNGYKKLLRKKGSIGSISYTDEELNRKIKSLPDWRLEGDLKKDEIGNVYLEVPFTR